MYWVTKPLQCYLYHDCDDDESPGPCSSFLEGSIFVVNKNQMRLEEMKNSYVNIKHAGFNYKSSRAITYMLIPLIDSRMFKVI